MKIYMKSINTKHKQIQMVKMLLSNIKTLQIWASIDTFENIHLVQAYHYYDQSKSLCKGITWWPFITTCCCGPDFTTMQWSLKMSTNRILTKWLFSFSYIFKTKKSVSEHYNAIIVKDVHILWFQRSEKSYAGKCKNFGKSYWETKFFKKLHNINYITGA